MTARTPAETTRKSKRPKEIKRRDGAGHLDAAYAQRLREQSEREVDSARPFISRSTSNDPLSEQLGEEFVANATSGEDNTDKAFQAHVAEDEGGPFIETEGATEFADDIDESNPEGSTREPLPKT